LINLTNLTYTVGVRTIIDDVTITIADGDRVAIVGRNGAGKSTLLKLMLGSIEASDGKILMPKNKDEIGYMPQHLADLGVLPNLSVLDFMLSGRRLDSLMKTMEIKIHEMNQ